MEYQYYEFQAIDRPLSNDDIEYVNSLSRRAECTVHRAVFTYSYGDFRADPLKVLVRCFDVLFYQANWGTTQLAFRFPTGAIDRQQVEPYCIEDEIEIFDEGDYIILNINIHDENMGGWIEPEGQLHGILPLRDALMQGDMRMLYIAWLKARQYYTYNVLDEFDDDMDEDDREAFYEDAQDVSDDVEPSVPPNLKNLSRSLHQFMDVFSVSQDMVAFAAEASDEQSAMADDFARWVLLLSDAERNDFLVRLAQGNAPVRGELLRRLREVGKAIDRAPPDAAQAPARRTVRELRAGAEAFKTQRKERECKAAAEARERELDALEARAETAWKEVFALIEEKKAQPYDQATKLLVNLRDVAARRNQQAAFQKRMDEIVTKYSNRSALLRRFREVRLM